MNRDVTPRETTDQRSFDSVWADDRGYLLGLAARMLGDRAEAEDVTQEAFSRLALVDIAEIDDVRGWLAVVVRRLCLDRIRSAYSRRETSAGATVGDDDQASGDSSGRRGVDPADRVTLDDQVQLALAVVLDRLTPAERTAFVLHDVFGFPYTDVAVIVGRTPAACRQLASRARRSIRSGGRSVQADPEATTQRLLTERFIAACAGGDIGELMALLDPDVVGEATLIGHGPLVRLRGRPAVAERVLALFGPGAHRTLVSVAVEGRPGAVVLDRGRTHAVIVFDEVGGTIHHITTFVHGPLRGTNPT